MTFPDQQKERWAALLRRLIAYHREQFPEDTRDDLALCHHVCQVFVEMGKIRVNKHGKYLLPHLMDDDC